MLGYLTFMASLPFGVVAHEAGHALAGWCVGLPPRLVTLGRGPVLLRARLGGWAWLVVRGIPFTGSVRCLPPTSGQRGAMAAVLLGGVLGNLILILLLATASALWPPASPILGAAAAMQGLLIAITLFPFKYRKQRSDGLRLLDLRRPLPDIRSLLDEAIRTLLPEQGGEPPLPIPSKVLPELFYQLFRPDRWTETWAAQDAAAVLQAVLVRSDLPPPQRAFVLASLLGMELTAIETGATPARLLVWAHDLGCLVGAERIKLFRGMALVMDGQFEAGQALLHATHAEPQGAMDCAANCALLAQAAAAQGDEAGACRWMNEARAVPRNDDLETVMPRLEARLAATRTRAFSFAPSVRQ